MNTQALAELLPCPMCGGEAHLERQGHVACKTGWPCVHTAYMNNGTPDEQNAEAITAWNTRQAASGGDTLHGFPVVVNPALPPDGWLLVPREPTPEMMKAGFLTESNGFDIEHPADAPGLVWQAMLSALPAAGSGYAEELLRIAMETLEQIATTPRNAGAKRNANATLRFIQTQAATCKDGLQVQQSGNSGWISVKDRLPIDLASLDGVFAEVAVIATDGYFVEQASFQAGNGAGKPWVAWSNYSPFNYYNPFRSPEITHWQPLPPPPGVGNE